LMSSSLAFGSMLFFLFPDVMTNTFRMHGKFASRLRGRAGHSETHRGIRALA
jgi:hypothetical protein